MDCHLSGKWQIFLYCESYCHHKKPRFLQTRSFQKHGRIRATPTLAQIKPLTLLVENASTSKKHSEVPERDSIVIRELIIIFLLSQPLSHLFTPAALKRHGHLPHWRSSSDNCQQSPSQAGLPPQQQVPEVPETDEARSQVPAAVTPVRCFPQSLQLLQLTRKVYKLIRPITGTWRQVTQLSWHQTEIMTWPFLSFLWQSNPSSTFGQG